MGTATWRASDDWGPVPTGTLPLLHRNSASFRLKSGLCRPCCDSWTEEGVDGWHLERLLRPPRNWACHAATPGGHLREGCGRSEHGPEEGRVAWLCQGERNTWPVLLVWRTVGPTPRARGRKTGGGSTLQTAVSLQQHQQQLGRVRRVERQAAWRMASVAFVSITAHGAGVFTVLNDSFLDTQRQ